MTELITSEWEITSSYIYNVAIKPCYIHLDWYDFERLAKEYKPAAAVIASGDSLHDVFIQSLKEISKIAGGKIKAMILSVAHNPSSALQMAEVSQLSEDISENIARDVDLSWGIIHDETLPAATRQISINVFTEKIN